MRKASRLHGWQWPGSRWLRRHYAAIWLFLLTGCSEKGDAGQRSLHGSGSSESGGNDAGGSGESAPNGGSSAPFSDGGKGFGSISSGGTGIWGGESGNSSGGANSSSSAAIRLLGAPFAFRPTAHGFGLNAVLINGDPSVLRAQVRPRGTALWGDSMQPRVRGVDIAEWELSGLGPGTRYDYEILASEASGERSLYMGSVVTQREAGEPFTFALITDSHIGPDLSYSNQGDSSVLKQVSAEVDAACPDFLVNLGDMLDFHIYGFNAPPPDSTGARQAYLNYRSLLGDTLGHAAHFEVIGTWEGEDGYYTVEELDRSRSQRLLYMPGPRPETYVESGSPSEDYYAYTWGDALFIVLNVMSYTTTEHLLSYFPGVPDDWTLGASQLNWLADTLAKATSKWRFILIHHPVGGAAGDDIDSAYGRGGGQAAYVGEQAKVHQLMLEYGVQILFYGHDHVFTDMAVDGVHYTLPGNSGAIWMFTASETGYSQFWPEYGWGRVTVSPDSVDVQFVKMGGELLYEYTLH
jgi:hypothetical protein